MTLEEYRQSPQFAKVMTRMTRDMLHFGRVCIPDMFTLDTPPIHYTFRDIAQSTDAELVNIISPRDTAKSSIFACILPLWHIFLEDAYLGRERSTKLIPVVSKTQGEARRRLRTIKNILGDKKTGKQSKNFVAHFGDWGENTAIKWTDTEIILKDGTMLLALGSSQQGRGLKEDHQRTTLLILDDPEDEKNTRTIDAMEKNLEILLNGFLRGLARGDRRGRAYVIGTPLNEKCMVETINRMAKKRDNWISRRFKYLNQDRDGNYYSIWPEKYSVEELISERDAYEAEGKGYMWYQEMQCSIVGREDQLISKDDILYWDGDVVSVKGKNYLEITHLSPKERPEELVELTETKMVPVNLFMGVDPAATISERADYSVILTRAFDAEENHYVVDVWQKRAMPHDVAGMIVSKFKSYRHTYAQVESQAFQIMLKNEVQRLMREQNLYIPGIEDKVDSYISKSEKFTGGGRYIASMQSDFKRKKVYVKKEHRNLVDEALMFRLGSKSNQDDCLDALYLSMRHSYKPQHSAALLEQKGPDMTRFGLGYDTKRDWQV